MSRSVANVTSPYCGLLEGSVGFWIPEYRTQNNHVSRLSWKALQAVCAAEGKASTRDDNSVPYSLHLDGLWSGSECTSVTSDVLPWKGHRSSSVELISLSAIIPCSQIPATHFLGALLVIYLLCVYFSNPIITIDMSGSEEQSLYQVPNSIQNDVFLSYIFKFSLIKKKPTYDMEKRWFLILILIWTFCLIL